MPIKSGIYKITNLVNNKIYIGSSKTIPRRWRDHKKDLKKNKHCNDYLQNSWNKYGEENFKFEIIEETTDDNEILKNAEQKWIDLLHPEYNMGLVSRGPNINLHPNRNNIISQTKITLNKYFSGLTDEEKSKKYGKHKENHKNWRGGNERFKCLDCGCQITKKHIRCKTCSGIYRSTQPVRIERYKTLSKTVEINGIVYPSVSEAARQLNITRPTIIRRIKKFPDKYKLI